MEAAGVKVSWHSQQMQPVRAVGGALIATVRICSAPVCIKDAKTGVWRRYRANFNVIQSPMQLLILGTPFLEKNNALINTGDGTVTLMHQESPTVIETVVTASGLQARADAGADGAAEESATAAGGQSAAQVGRRTVGAVARSIDEVLAELDQASHPYVFTTEEVTLPAAGGLGVQVQLPHTFAGEEIVLVPLPDSDTTAYANRKRLRLHGPLIVKPDAEGNTKAVIYNFSGKDVILPAYSPVGQYLTDPELAPHADMTVD
jgi:hypothetical protein